MITTTSSQVLYLIRKDILTFVERYKNERNHVGDNNGATYCIEGVKRFVEPFFKGWNNIRLLPWWSRIINSLI